MRWYNRGALFRWHRHFAWLPVRLQTSGCWAWLEWVWRRGTEHTSEVRRRRLTTWWTWEYRDA